MSDPGTGREDGNARPDAGQRSGMPMEPREGYTALGRVTRPHGLRGEVRVQAFAPGAPNMQAGRYVYLQGVRRRVLRARQDRDAWILQLQGLTNRDQVEAARGELVEALDTEVRRDDPESYFVHELIGLRAVTEDGEELGRVADVLQQGSADVYVVRGERGEILLPAIADVIHRIDVAEGVMVITPLPGLLDEPK